MSKTKKPMWTEELKKKKSDDAKITKNDSATETIRSKKPKFVTKVSTKNVLDQKNSKPKQKVIEKTAAVTKLKKFINNKFVIIGSIIVVVAIGLGITIYYLNSNKNEKNIVSPPPPEDIQTIVGRLIELPNEEVKLATVVEREKLADHPFFEHAENGDKTLIYMQSKKAILYRPSTNKIIEVMYISTGQDENAESSQQSAEATAQQGQVENQEQVPSSNATADATAADAPDAAKTQVEPIKIAVYNGTNKKGLATSVAEKLSSMENISIIKKTNAKGNFESTSIVDLNGNMAEASQKIKEIIGGEIGALPAGEVKPAADILIIAGNQ